jgi:hypothetical protein
MRILLTTFALGLVAGAAPAQLNLRLNFSFVDNQASGNGNIGVTQDERLFRYWVLDFSNTNTVHEFDRTGTFLAQYPTASCTPRSPTPNDVTYDPVLDRLWLVDNDNPNCVLQMDRSGACTGGWTFVSPSLNPVGITFDRRTNSLWISSNDQVTQWDKTGNRLSGGFRFTPTGGTNILSGVAHDLRTDRFYITQSNGTRVFEVDKTGMLVSTTSLAPFGVVDTQGIHYSLPLNQLVVVDNTQSRTYVFDLAGCAGSVTARGTGCRDPQGAPLTLAATGCPDLGRQLTLALQVHAANVARVFFAAGVSDTTGFGLPLPIDLTALGAPGCSIYTSTDLLLGPVNNTGGGASLVLTVPNDPSLVGRALHWQGLQAGPPIVTPLPVATSNTLRTTFG